jgi:hypothetical protein
MRQLVRAAPRQRTEQQHGEPADPQDNAGEVDESSQSTGTQLQTRRVGGMPPDPLCGVGAGFSQQGSGREI